MTGQVKEIDGAGNVYKGEMLKGVRHGKGILLYAGTGDVYQGDFEGGLPHGSGKYIREGKVDGNKNGIFEGLWHKGVLTQVKKGKAKIELENGDVYEGGFNHWKRHGKGKLVEYNGAIYNGQWKDGLRNGPGRQSYPDGYVFEGKFKDDKPVNDGTQREAHSVTGDSAILNPYQEETQDPLPSRKNGKAGKVSPQRSIKVKQSKGIKSAPTPKNNQRSSSRKRQTQIEEPNALENLPRTISFRSVSFTQNGGEDSILSMEENNFAVPQNLARPPSGIPKRNKASNSTQQSMVTSAMGEGDPLEMKRKQLERLKEGKCLRKFALNTISRTEKQQARQQSRQQSRQSSNKKDRQGEDDNGAGKKKGFSFLRTLSRGRSRSRKGDRLNEPPQAQQNDSDMFVNREDENIGETFFDSEIQQFGVVDFEEASGLTPPEYRDGRISTQPQVRSRSPHPRASSRPRQSRMENAIPMHAKASQSRSRSRSRHPNVGVAPVQVGAQRSRSRSRSRQMHDVEFSTPPDAQQMRSRSRSVSRHMQDSGTPIQTRHSRSKSRPRQMQNGQNVQTHRRSPPRSMIPSKQRSSPQRGREYEEHQMGHRDRSRSRPRHTNKFGQSQSSEWVRSSSKGRMVEKRSPSPTKNLHRVQGLHKNPPRDNSNRHQRRDTTPYQYSPGHEPGMSGGNGRSYSGRRSRSRGRNYDQPSANKTYKESVRTGRSNYSDVHMVRSISNKGRSATLGMLEMNRSDDADPDYFVR